MEKTYPLKSYTDELEGVLVRQLQLIDQENSSVILRSEVSIHCILDAMSQLKKFILKYRFKSKAEEIEFFKKVKPRFASRLLYHHIVFRIETRKPFGNDKVIRKYLQQEIAKLKRYFDKNLEFYSYYRSDSSHLDDKYFIRNKYDIRLHPDSSYFDADHRFSTTHDHNAATIIAHGEAIGYIENELLQLSESVHPLKSISTKHALEWTESKSALVELIYALHYQGAVESSKAGIKEIAACFESLFRIELGDYYRTFMDIKTRKSGKAKFLESLRDNLINKLEETESRW